MMRPGMATARNGCPLRMPAAWRSERETGTRLYSSKLKVAFMALTWQKLGRIAIKIILDKWCWSEIASDLWEKLDGSSQEQITEIKFDLNSLEFRVNERTAEDYEGKNLFSSAYTYYFYSLEAAFKLDWEFRITGAFDNLIRCLQKGAKVTNSERAEAKKLMNKISEKYKAQVTAFSDLIEKAPEFKVGN